MIPWRGQGLWVVESCSCKQRIAVWGDEPWGLLTITWRGGGFKYVWLSPRPYLGKWSNLTNIFQMGWNHQLDDMISLHFAVYLVCLDFGMLFFFIMRAGQTDMKVGREKTEKRKTMMVMMVMMMMRRRRRRMRMMMMMRMMRMMMMMMMTMTMMMTIEMVMLWSWRWRRRRRRRRRRRTRWWWWWW